MSEPEPHSTTDDFSEHERPVDAPSHRSGSDPSFGTGRPHWAGIDPPFGTEGPHSAGIDPPFETEGPHSAGIDPSFDTESPHSVGIDSSFEAESDPTDDVLPADPARSNPADPSLSAEPGREKRRLLLPVSIAVGLLLGAALWWAITPHGPKPPIAVFESVDLGCRFQYPSELTAGPNFVRSGPGSLLTIERHSLDMARKDWVAGLPDILFPQVLIQINENYTDIAELSRTPVTVDGRKGLEVVLKGRAARRSYETLITVVIFATDDWAYVLRSYSSEDRDAAERPLFRMVRETWKFLPGPGPRTTS